MDEAAKEISSNEKIELELDCTKSVWKNLEELYQKLKQLEEKKRKILQEIEKTKEEIKNISTTKAETQKQKQEIKKQKKWYENFLWFYTTNGFLVIAGKNAKQNDELYSKYLKDEDLFFHADMIGAPATILKNGANAKEEDRVQAAQWAAAYSSAWKKRLATIDVYYVKKEQVSKYSQGQYVGKGAFLILGKRNWLKNVQLALKIIIENEEAYVLPNLHSKSSSNQILLYPGDIEKEKAIELIAQKIKMKKEKIGPLLPAGGFEIR
ncbi:MAG: NFACT RNA binding domain-containing protein [Candidatus Micrarchaeota archaeon]|nr:NFACT RNA binding domain-containing protein [Candidatus Micrarchaeota archaeon]